MNGWELIGVAEGLRLINEMSFVDAVASSWKHSRDFLYWTPANSTLFSIIPGLLTDFYPWLYWSQAFLAACAISAHLFICRALKLNLLISLAFIGISPALISFSVIGYPYLSAIIPYCLALPLVFRENRLNTNIKSLFFDLIALFGIYELSMHCYELGKSAVIIPVLAALFLPQIPWSRRIVWILSAILFAGYTVWIGGSNINFFTFQNSSHSFSLSPLLSLFKEMTINWSFGSTLILCATLISLTFIRKNRAFWIFLVLAELGFLMLLSLKGEYELRTRRFLVFQYICVLANTFVWSSIFNKKLLSALLCLLLFGHSWVLYKSWSFFSEPLVERSLPHINSIPDLYINKSLIEDSQKLVELIEHSKSTHFIFYDNTFPPENRTDPQAFSERILLQLGYHRLTSDVIFVGKESKVCRYNCFPRKSKEEFLAHAAKIKKPFHIHFYKQLDSLEQEPPVISSSNYKPISFSLNNFSSYLIETFNPPSTISIKHSSIKLPQIDKLPIGMCKLTIENINASKLSKHLSTQQANLTKELVRYPIDRHYSKNVSEYLRGYLINNKKENVYAELNVRIDDEAIITINDTLVFSTLGNRAASDTSLEIEMPPGISEVKIYYANLAYSGVLKFSILDKDENPILLHCSTQPSS